MSVSSISNWIGYTAPLWLALMGILQLRTFPIYCRWFVGGLIVNQLINMMLKLVIREPRPTSTDQEKRWGEQDEYGMPSAHTQQAAFIIAFLWCPFSSSLSSSSSSSVTTSIWPLLLSVALLLSTMIQRYLSHHHTISQILIGLAVGLTMGHMTQSMATKFITGRFHLKPSIEPDTPLTTF